MIDDDMKNVLVQAHNIFCINNGISPVMFMKLKDNKDLVIEYIDMDTLSESIDSFDRIKKKIEIGELLEYIFMFDDKVDNDWVLVVIKANIKEEIQCECKVWIEHGVYNFSKWSFYDNSRVLGRRGFVNNLFGQVFCKFN